MQSQRMVVVGAGPLGSAVARRAAEQGSSVVVITRSGGGPDIDGVRHIALDATDRAALGAASAGADVIVNCANPGSYQAWEREWPPLAAAILGAAEDVGAVLVTLSNLYGYGPVDAPMTRHMLLRPSDHKGALRARMWEDARVAHEAGRVRATEARASDYIGPTAPTASSILARYAAATLAGKPATVFRDPDQPHAWTAVDDIAATLLALAQNEQAWGSPWIVPSSPPTTVRGVLSELSRLSGAPAPRLRTLPRPVVRMGGWVVPILRELEGVLYQFDRPFLVDTAETTAVLGIRATPWPTVLAETAVAWRDRAVG